MSILGNRVVRQEDPRLLTAGGSYVEDLALPGASFVAFVRSNVAHGRIRSIDATAARSAPGVREVLTLSDMDPPPARLRAGAPHQTTVIPIDRAVPATWRRAASRSSALRSGILTRAISVSC
jgi:CO/xanthine dehydrogenase Mo-binding subunit